MPRKDTSISKRSDPSVLDLNTGPLKWQPLKAPMKYLERWGGSQRFRPLGWQIFRVYISFRDERIFSDNFWKHVFIWVKKSYSPPWFPWKRKQEEEFLVLCIFPLGVTSLWCHNHLARLIFHDNQQSKCQVNYGKIINNLASVHYGSSLSLNSLCTLGGIFGFPFASNSLQCFLVAGQSGVRVVRTFAQTSTSTSKWIYENLSMTNFSFINQ